ncbi:tetratricopeptide repeat protein [Pseudoxanthomonas wuyuanensis]
MYDTIIDALRRNAADEALTAARELVANRPDDAQAHRWLATSLQQSGQAEAALASIDHAIALAPEDADLHLARAGVLIGSRRIDEAQGALATSSGLDPNQFLAYLMQAQLALGRGDLDEAERLSRLAARVNPEHPLLAAVDGMVALRRGDAEHALKIVSAAAQVAPEDPQLRFTLGFVYMAKQHWAFAEQAFRGIVDSNPAAANLRSLIADLVRRQGRPADAADELEPLLANPATSGPGLHRYAGHLRLAAGQNEQALASLRTALAGNPRDRETLLGIIEAWRRLNAPDDARATLDAALATTPDSHELWLARLLFETVGSEQARAVVERWLTAMPDHLPALEAQMAVLDFAGDAAGAEAIAQRIVELEPGRSSGEQRLVEALLARDEPKAAIARVQSLIERATDPQARQGLRGWLGLVQDRAGRQAEAVATWTALAQEAAPTRLPLWPQTEAAQAWPPLAPLPQPLGARPLLLWGAPGSGVEAIVGVVDIQGGYLRADRFGPAPPQDGLQSYRTPAALASGALTGEELIGGWRAAFPARQVSNGNIVDWLLWWDNALLHALRPQVPEGMLLIALRDPRDMLLDWLAFGAPAPLAITDAQQGADWLAQLLGQVAELHEQDLYPHRLIRLDGIVHDPAAISAAVGQALDTAMPPPPRAGARRFPEGHWRNYAQALKQPFAVLAPVAQRLGYPEA